MKIGKLSTIAFVLIFSMILFSGCANTAGSTTGSSSTGSSTGSSTTASTAGTTGSIDAAIENNLPDMPVVLVETPEGLEYMDDLSPITFSIFYNDVVSTPWTWGENPVEKKITELSGVSLDGTYAADSEGNSLTLMLASGDPLPDIMTNIATNSIHMREMIDSDAIYPLNELIDEYCPKMWDMMSPLEKTYFSDDEGNLWYFIKGLVDPDAANNGYMIDNGNYAVRADIREALGNPPLDTIEDVWAFLALWEENKADYPEITYPISFLGLIDAANPMPYYNSFGGNLDYNASLLMEYSEDDDNVYYWVETDAGHKTLKFYYDLAQAGYVDQESFSLTSDSMLDAIKSGKILLYGSMNVWPIDSYSGDLEQNLPGATYERILPPVDTGVTPCYISNPISHWGSGTVITKDCEDPERAIKFMEFMGTEYANALVIWGIYGENFELTKKNSAGILYPTFLGDATDDANWGDLGMYQYQKLWFKTYSDFDCITGLATLETQPDLKVVAEIFKSNVAAAVPSKVTFAADSEASILRGGLETIISTEATKCILAANETEFEAYYQNMLATLKSSGLDEFKQYVLADTKTFLEVMANSGYTFK